MQVWGDGSLVLDGDLTLGGELPTIVLFFEVRDDKVLVPLVYVLCPTAGALIYRVDRDVKNHLPKDPGLFALVHQHCQVEEGSKGKNTELGRSFDVPEIDFGNIKLTKYLFQI